MKNGREKVVVMNELICVLVVLLSNTQIDSLNHNHTNWFDHLEPQNPFPKGVATNAQHITQHITHLSIMNSDLCPSLKVKDINHLIDARYDASCD